MNEIMVTVVSDRQHAHSMLVSFRILLIVAFHMIMTRLEKLVLARRCVLFSLLFCRAILPYLRFFFFYQNFLFSFPLALLPFLSMPFFFLQMLLLNPVDHYMFSTAKHAHTSHGSSVVQKLLTSSSR